MTITTVHLLRHGEVHNPDHVMYGRLPGYHLSAVGRRMAERAAKALLDRDVTYLVSKASALSRGRPFDEDGAQVVRHMIEQQITAESMPLVLSGLVYDDGIIDPRDTRDVLGVALSAIHSAPIIGAESYGVFRM